MSAAWPLVTLGEVLELKVDAVPVDASATYLIAGVYSFGKGLLARGPLPGTETTYKIFHRLHLGDFVLSQLKAWEGAMARVTASFDGWFLSPQFPTFRAKPDRLDIEYLDYYCKQSKVWDQLRSSARGMGDRRDSVSPAKFLSATIPLPPLAEQRRIVARIEELAAKIDEARGIRQQAVEDSANLYQSFLGSIMNSNHSDWTRETIGDVLLSLDAGWSPQCGERPAKDDEWGVLKTTSVQWCEFRPFENKLLPSLLSPRAQLCVESGDVLVTRAGPRKRVGVVAAVRSNFRNLMISDKLIRLRPDQTKIQSRFLELAIASPFSQEHLVSRKTGLADAQVNISQAILRKTPISYPILKEQDRIIAYLDNLQTKVDSLKRVQAETSSELDAMLPSILDKAFQGAL